MKTKSELFIEEKRDNWNTLKRILEKTNVKSESNLDEEEVKMFPGLYRLVCADLAEAKMLKLSSDVIEYINNIVGHAHKILYHTPPLKKSVLKLFFKEKLPAILIKNKIFILLSAILFLGSYFISFYTVYNNPEYARAVISEEVLEMMESSYKTGFTENRSAGAGTFALSFYIQHNVTIAFFSFAAGIFFGIGSVYFLLYNGIALGVISGYIVSLGHSRNFWNFVCAHSVFELTGLIISGAAGLCLGYTILKATRYYRKDYIKLKKENILTLVCAGFFMIVFAAAIEGNISPSLLSFEIKISIAILSLSTIIYYFIIKPLLNLKIIKFTGKKNK